MIDKNQIDKNKVPKHIAIIMDGNGRWAKQQGENRLFGHQFGVESVREALEGAREIGVQYLTLYAFSTENWNRPKEEVDGLMALFVKSLAQNIGELHEKGVRLMAIGNIKGLPLDCQNELQQSVDKTANNQDINLVLALNYSSKWEIVDAIKNISQKVALGSIQENQINEQLVSDYLTTTNIPDPELMIRTSGERRISNFLLWQMAYTEFYFTAVLWPDFTRNCLYEAVCDYQNRERRFGMVSEQLNNDL